MLNTKYMIFGDPQNPEAVPNPQANGNAWFVSDVKFVNTPNQEIKLIGEVNTKQTAIVSSADREYFDGKPIAADSTGILKLTGYRADALEFRTESKTPQLAVFSEIYYPKGWKMFIDEKEVPYIKANYLLRAVYVPAGVHTVRMVFEPEVIQTGKLVSMICFGIFLLLSIGGIYFLFRHKNNGNPADYVKNVNQ